MKLSETLHALLEEYAERSLMLATLLDRTGEKGFGIVSAFLTLPMLLPLPIPIPGISALFGVGTLVMGLQMLLGWHRPHLPRPIARIEFSPKLSRELLKNLTRILHPLERLARPRLFSIGRGRLLYRLVGLCLFWNALLLSLPLPIPFTNLLPAYTILILAIGILETDGFLLLVGYGMTLATTTFFASIAGIAWALIAHLVEAVSPR